MVPSLSWSLSYDVLVAWSLAWTWAVLRSGAFLRSVAWNDAFDHCLSRDSSSSFLPLLLLWPEFDLQFPPGMRRLPALHTGLWIYSSQLIYLLQLISGTVFCPREVVCLFSFFIRVVWWVKTQLAKGKKDKFWHAQCWCERMWRFFECSLFKICNFSFP